MPRFAQRPFCPFLRIENFSWKRIIEVRITRLRLQKGMNIMTKKLTMLMILDGYGYNPATEGNAIYSAKTPVMDKILSECSNTLINASGMDVGLPDGQMGNSEVGHTNIGAGRIVYQEITRITKYNK